MRYLLDTGPLVAFLNENEKPTLRHWAMDTLASLPWPLHSIITSYHGRKVSLADACLVRLVELTSQSTLFTLDSDFEIYRQKGRRLIPLLTPR